MGHKVLARVPLFEVPAGSPAAKLAKELGVPLLEGKALGSVRLDATHPHWAHVVVHELVETAAERGFDGVMLSELETMSHDAERAALLRVLPMLKSAYPDKQLFLEGGASLLREARRHLDGIVFIEETGANADADSALRLERKILDASRQGVCSYVVGFENPEKPTNIAARAARIRQLGGVPFFTTPDIHGANLGPLLEVSRRILVLHTGAARETYTARLLHGSLEWLGYQVTYQDASQEGSAWMPGHQGVSAVILDQSLSLSRERQHALAELVTTLAEQKVPLLLTGQPWANAGDWAQVSKVLGLSGTGSSVAKPAAASVKHAEADLMMNPGAISPRVSGLRDVRLTTDDGKTLLSLQADHVEHSQVALTTWGGLWLDPLALEAGPQVNPLPFLESLLSRYPTAPVMDTTSLDGRRLLVTHISSEGYAETTDLPGLPVAAEAMLEKVVSKYALPMTVAVSEADVRGWTPGVDARQAPRLQEAARTLFTLSHVEAASGTMSRPTTWEGKTASGGLMNASAPEKDLSMEREVAGSLGWLHRQFLGQGQAMRLVSWPQGSFPSAEASAFSHQMSVENVATQSSATLAGRISPLPARGWSSGESFSTVLTQNTGDAAAFIAEATRTGQRRWLSPVQVSLSFHDAASANHLKQVEKMLDWCASQPFQAVTVGEYARLMRDASRTRLFQTGADRWIIVNEGRARTLRLPASAGVPDLAACTGVSGFTRQGDQVYIHTLGLRRTELVMRRDAERDYLRLASSTGSVSYLEAGSSRALLQVSHTRPVEMSFEGIMPGSICQMIANGAPDYLMAGPDGRIEFTVPSQATVQLRILPEHKAAMR
ncbi:hypothetical protein [Brevifollis gellanilyticus]|uniref:hypothetical protein n=1 Tax=Brevifollis gellanilyticus TaxID=748831 RepID=UPI0011BF623D|nr:hypothetical protein [Brevifollis gellanilyticus]